MKGKKVLSLSIALTMALSSALLSGCGSNAKSEAPKQAEQKTASTAAGEKPKEVVTLKMLGGNDKFNPQEDIQRQRIKDMLGYDIVGEIAGSEDKFTVVLASGEEYDIVKIGNNKALLAQLIKNKSVRPLNEAIDKYGPNLKKAFSDEVWAMGSNDGKKYALFNTNYEVATEGIAIRQDWLKKLNMQAPTNADELYNVLKAFKEKDPGGVGDKNVIPVSFDYDANKTLSFNGVIQSFGLGRDLDSYVEKDGKLVLGLELPGAKEYVAYIKKLYSEGLIDPDFINNKWTNFEQKLGAGNVGVAFMSCWYSGAQAALQKSNPESKLVFTEPLKSKAGAQGVQRTGGIESIVVVPNASKKVDDVIKFANSFMDPKNYTKLVIGDENVHYKNENGKLTPTDKFKELNLARWFFPVNEGKEYTKIFDVRARKTPEMGAMWDDVKAKGDKFGYVDPLAYAPSLPEVVKNAKPLREFLVEKLVKLIIDKNTSIDQFDQIVKEYKAKGGDEVAKAYNTWYASKKK